MTQAEFLRWQEFYLQEPFDDLHRFHRPAALIATRLAGGSISDMLDFLQPSESDSEFSDADLATFKAFGVKPPR
ncbi:phage tail assembly protein T [Paralcaligenes ginsengisoli]